MYLILVCKLDKNISVHLNTFTSCSMGTVGKALPLFSFWGHKNAVIALQNIRHDFGGIKVIDQKMMERI